MQGRRPGWLVGGRAVRRVWTGVRQAEWVPACASGQGLHPEVCGLTAAGMATLRRPAHHGDAGVEQRLTTDACVLRRLLLEEGFPEATTAGLKQRGHTVVAGVGGHDRAVFGRGQIIRRDPHSGVLWGGSDPRADGQVLGW